MTAAAWSTGRLRRALGALRFPWPKEQASLPRLILLGLGAAFGPLPPEMAPAETAWRLLALQACTLSGFFGTVLLNDLADRELDTLAHPERPLARGDVRPLDAAILCALLYLITAVSSALLGGLLFALILFWLSVPVAAHYFLVKRGRVRVGGGGGRWYSDLITPFQFAGLGVLVYLGFQNYDLRALFLLSAIIYCSDGALNVLQGIRDRRADAVFRISTVAVRHGVKDAARVALELHACVLPLALLYAWQADISLFWCGWAAAVWSICLPAMWRAASAPNDAARVERAIAAQALALQLLLVGLGGIRIIELFA